MSRIQIGTRVTFFVMFGFYLGRLYQLNPTVEIIAWGAVTAILIVLNALALGREIWQAERDAAIRARGGVR